MQNKEQVVRVKIKNCKYDYLWYKDLVGEQVDVYDDFLSEIFYNMSSDPADLRQIFKDDCEVTVYKVDVRHNPETSELFMAPGFNIKDALLLNPEKVDEGEKAGIIQQEAENYQPLFDVLSNIFGEMTIVQDMDEIIKASQQVVANFEKVDEGEGKELTYEECKTLFNKLQYGDIVTNHWASSDNPHRVGSFVKKSNHGGRRCIELTDTKGDFWYLGIDKGHKISIQKPSPQRMFSEEEIVGAMLHAFNTPPCFGVNGLTNIEIVNNYLLSLKNK